MPRDSSPSLAILLAAVLAAGCGGSATEESREAAEPNVVPGATLAAETDGASPAATAERTFDLIYRAKIDRIPPEAKILRVWIPYPVGDENQEVEVTEISAPIPHQVRREPEFGNRVLYLETENPDRESVEIVMTARVHRNEVLRKEFGRSQERGAPSRGPEITKWLEPDELVPVHDERIRRLSAEVTEGADTDLEKARAIYDYVVTTMTYSKQGTGWGRGDIYWACDAKTGNCTDFHALFTGLARAAGIPAKFAIGFPIPADRGRGKVGGYHCWSEFYLDGYGWVPVDASEAAKDPSKKDYFFGGHDENRVEFTEGRDLVLRPEQQSDPLNYFIYPHVEIDGASHDAVDHELVYRDIAEGGVRTAAH